MELILIEDQKFVHQALGISEERNIEILHKLSKIAKGDMDEKDVSTVHALQKVVEIANNVTEVTYLTHAYTRWLMSNGIPYGDTFLYQEKEESV